MSAAGSIPDTNLGLTQSELLILRQQTEIATQSRTGTTAAMDRGRGTSRHSQPSSRAASAASSHSIQGRITMDSNSLVRIEQALQNLMRQISARIEQLETTIEDSVAATQRGAANTLQSADEEIKKTKMIMQELDKLEAKFEEVNTVCEKIRKLRHKCDQMGGRMDSTMLARSGGGGGGGGGGNRVPPSSVRQR